MAVGSWGGSEGAGEGVERLLDQRYAVDAALAPLDRADHVGRVVAIARATRAWALAEPATFLDLLKRYPKAASVPGDGRQVTELDALVGYLQVLGTMIDFADPANERLQQ